MSKGLPSSAAWQIAQKNIVQVAFVRWRGDSKIVEANAEHDFRLKRLIGMLRTIKRVPFFCAICQAALQGRPFDTRIHIGKFSEFPIWQKAIIALRRRGSMSLSRPAAGGESCKQDSFLLYVLG